MSDEARNGHRIAVISDTHNLLRPEVAEVIRTCEVVLHGGDISGPQTLEEIRNLCGPNAVVNPEVHGADLSGIGLSAATATGRLFVVRGNNDRDWAQGIPYSLKVELFGCKFFMTHKKKDIPADVDADVVIYGHSHRYAQEDKDGTLFLNPGSCGPRRFNQAITMAVLTVPEADSIVHSFEGSLGVKFRGIRVEKIEIPHRKPGSEQVAKKELVSADLIRKIGSDLEKHRTVSEISAKRNVSPELAEQIVRLYVTHPGVTAEQIMSKMGL